MRKVQVGIVVVGLLVTVAGFTHSGSAKANERLKILSLNTWLLPSVLVKDYHERLEMLPHAIASTGAEPAAWWKCSRAWKPRAT